MQEQEVLGIPFADNPYPMWIWDLETLAFLAVNDAAIQRYGYTQQEYATMNVLDIRPPEDKEKFLKEIDPKRRIGHSTAEMWRHRKKDGEIFNVRITSWALTYRGRRAELALARPEKSKAASNGAKRPCRGPISESQRTPA
jgi:PAS domain S-box-containing protein